MEHLTDLFKLMELSRAQAQHGLILRGVKRHELSDLAAHHYLVAFTAWQLAYNLKAAGADLDIEKVLEYSLIHDLGELLGSDISMIYQSLNRKAYKHAKEFENENIKFLARFFGKRNKHFRDLNKEMLDAKSDEALLAKVADYIENTHYVIYIDKIDEKRELDLTIAKILCKVKKIKDPIAKRELEKFVDTIGNLTLLEEGKNKGFHRKNFSRGHHHLPHRV